VRRIAVLPTLMTLSNGLCGLGATVYVVRAQRGAFAEGMVTACWLVLAAMVLDALDGSVARMTKGATPFGAELDSLADVISFGLAPSLMVMAVAAHEDFLPRIRWITGSLFLVCAMMRLARHNVESLEHSSPADHFAGLPSPAAGGLVASLVLIHFSVTTEVGVRRIVQVLHLQWAMGSLVKFLPIVAILTAVLMVSRIPYAHLGRRLLREKEPFDYVVRLVLLGLFAFVTWPFSIPLVFSIYVAWGLCAAAHRRITMGAGHAAPSEGE